MEYKILIIEDEPTINRILSKYFLDAGYHVKSAFDGFEGLQIFEKDSYDLICLDIMMPNINGWEVAKIIREHSNVPIIMMSALSEEEDILQGYSLKVDDYITKPYNPKILLAKARNLLERAKTPLVDNTRNIISAGLIEMDLNAHKVRIDDQSIELSKTEFDLLKYFLNHQGQICSRNLLLDEVWGIDVYVEDRIVDTYVKKLRKLFGKEHNYIKTIFGVGYRFEVSDE
jgi:DNA-binding response OmpR family regulator